MKFNFNDLKGQTLNVYLVENYGLIANPHFDQDNQILMSEIGFVSGTLLEDFDEFILLEVIKKESNEKKKVLISKNYIKMIEIE
jgi:hypothetical protein